MTTIALKQEWPSIKGSSIFVSDPHFQTPEYRLFTQVDRDERERGRPTLDWHWFRDLCNVIGVEKLRKWFNAPSIVDLA